MQNEETKSMKMKLFLLTLLSAFSLQPSALLHAATSINAVNHYAYGANLGWVDWRGDTSNGAIIGATFCSGYIYSANVGWINLGSGAPTNGVQYQNLSADDFGVNVDTLGNLNGLAYGANIGWIAFEGNGAPKVDFGSGNLSGYAWGANVGWISLSNAVAFVQTAPLAPANDLCSGAIALTNGVAFTMSTITATSTGDLAPSCAGSFGKGVWFTYTPMLSGTVTLSTCASDFDTALGVYAGNCQEQVLRACNDDNGPSCTGTRASVTFTGAAGVTYLILAGGYGSYSGNLNILVTSPSNDQCASAVPLADGVPFTQNTASATSTSDPVPSCQANTGKGVWFTYTAPVSGDVLASTCGSSFDTVLTVYAGGCRRLIPVACDDDNGPSCSGLNASLRFPANAGVTYYLLAGGFNNYSGNLSLVASLVPVLAFGHSSGNLTMTWSGNGTLQSATNLSPVPTWTDVTNGGGVWTEPMTNPAKFFRVVK
jgi:hypothetical protein